MDARNGYRFRRSIRGIAALLLFVAAGGLMGETVSTLVALRDHARVLLIFAPDAEDARLKQQLRELRGYKAEMAERDLVAIAVQMHGAAQTETALSAAEDLEVRRRFGVGPKEFVVVLVGKDGGEKLRSKETLAFGRLREVIDAMPMRREEMRKKR